MCHVKKSCGSKQKLQDPRTPLEVLESLLNDPRNRDLLKDPRGRVEDPRSPGSNTPPPGDPRSGGSTGDPRTKSDGDPRVGGIDPGQIPALDPRTGGKTSGLEPTAPPVDTRTAGVASGLLPGGTLTHAEALEYLTARRPALAGALRANV